MSGAASHANWGAEYEALVKGHTVVDLARTQIEVWGADRARFLHNLCTNEVRKLAAGAGCEAFLTSVQGKTLAHVFVFAGPESLIIDTVGGQAEAILKHLDHYLVSEQVTLADRSDAWTELLVGESVLQRVCREQLPAALYSHAAAEISGRRVWLRRVEIASTTELLLNVSSEDAAAIRAALVEAGAVECGRAAFEAARIERGFPWFGRDITDKNLPQEVARDRLAISFVKGCYLGQETVARIDALGHVNKTLVGVRFEDAEVPAAGTELSAGGQKVGEVTSAAFSPRLRALLALAYVRRGSNAAGTRLESAVGAAEVVDLPLV